MITIDIKQGVDAALKAFDEGRLSAQHTGGCLYRDDHQRPCVVGAMISDEDFLEIDLEGMNASSVLEVIERGVIEVRGPDDSDFALDVLQDIHDSQRLDLLKEGLLAIKGWLETGHRSEWLRAYGIGEGGE